MEKPSPLYLLNIYIAHFLCVFQQNSRPLIYLRDEFCAFPLLSVQFEEEKTAEDGPPEKSIVYFIQIIKISLERFFIVPSGVRAPAQRSGH